MRSTASVLHLDLDAFFASVEQRDKPSLRGKPVVVGGVGMRGVVSTASYEARVFGVHSAMPMSEARRRCPHAAFLGGRFGAYRASSVLVMAELRALSPRLEPLSIDEAFCDLAVGDHDLSDDGLQRLARGLKKRVAEVTGGLRASVGLGSSKFIAKLATELGKPDGLHLVSPGEEVATISPLPVSVIPGVGPVTEEKLRRLGLRTVADLQQASEHELERELGRASATSLHALAFARDERPVDADREAKSISVEDTFETDVHDRDLLLAHVHRDARLVAERLRKTQHFARTVTLKVRLGDGLFTTWTRSRTLEGATDRDEVIAEVAESLLATLDLNAGIRLIGVGVAGLTDVAQEQLFDLPRDRQQTTQVVTPAPERRPPAWTPGADVSHREFGAGWVWGTGLGRVTVRFETAETGPGPVRTFSLDDPALQLVRSEPPPETGQA